MKPFLAVPPGGEPVPVQVCADFSLKATQERELGALFEAMDERPLARGLIITLDHRESFHVGADEVRILPAHAWFLRDEWFTPTGASP